MLNDDAELTKYAKDDQPNVNQTAAVSSDMTSYAASMTFDDCVQVFYARSDYTLDTWNLPPQIQVPVERRSPSEWERALSSCTHTINSGVSVHTVVVEVPVYLEEFVSPALFIYFLIKHHRSERVFLVCTPDFDCIYYDLLV